MVSCSCCVVSRDGLSGRTNVAAPDHPAHGEKFPILCRRAFLLLGRAGRITIGPRDARRSGSPARRDHRQGRRRAGGPGRLVFVSGESGAGKTSFVEAFIDRWVRDERVLWGACDPLPTPRPLGPIHDVAHRLAPATQRVLAESDAPYDIFDAVYDDLRTAPSVLVLDDLQWADQGTIRPPPVRAATRLADALACRRYRPR